MQALLPAILNNLERMLDVLVRDGFGPLESAYLDAWLHTGQQVQASPLQALHLGHIGIFLHKASWLSPSWCMSHNQSAIHNAHNQSAIHNAHGRTGRDGSGK